MLCNFKTTKKELTVRSMDVQSCCAPQQPDVQMECPECHQKAKSVLARTLQHLLTDNVKKSLSCFDGFYYCKTRSCNVVYFRESTIFTQQDINVVVGLKDGTKPETICYCFEWTKEKIREALKENAQSDVLEDIKKKMRKSGCSCEILNPSGVCCLGDLSKAIREIKADMNMID